MTAPRQPTPGRHRRTWVMAGVVLAFLVVVVVVGLFQGDSGGGDPNPSPASSVSTTDGP